MSFKKPPSRFFSLLLASSLAFGCGSSDSDAFLNSPGQTLSPPTAVDNRFAALGNAPLQLAAEQGVFGNDILRGGTLAGFDATGPNGGTLALQNDGSLLYTPSFGFTGTERFTYTLENAEGTSTADIEFQVSDLAFFVNNTASVGGNGSFTEPFTTLAQASAAAGTDDTIFVFRGNGTAYGGDLALQNGQKLIGEGVGLTVEQATLSRVLTQQIVGSGTAPVLSGAVILANGNTVSGLSLDGSGSDSIRGSAVENANIRNNEFSNYAEAALDFDSCTGTIEISDNTFRPVNALWAVEIEASTGNSELVLSNNLFSGEDGVTPSGALMVLPSGTANLGLAMNGGNYVVDTGGGAWGEILNLQASGGTTNLTVQDETCLSNTSGYGLTASGSALLNSIWSRNRISQIADGDAVEIRHDGTSRGSVLFRDNVLTDVEDNGFEVRPQGDAQVSVICNSNEVTRCDDDGLNFNADGNSTVTLECRNNLVSFCNDLIECESLGTATLTGVLSGNVVSNAGNRGLLCGALGGSLTLDISNNNSSLSDNAPMSFTTFSGTVGRCRLRDNVFSDVDDATRIQSFDNSTLCLDATGNTFDELRLSQNDTSTLNVERFDAGTGGPFGSVNTVGTPTNSGTITAVVAGFCGF